MRAVVSRVLSAAVTVGEKTVGAIEAPGLLALVGVSHHDTVAIAEQMADKLYGLRILRNEQSCASSGSPLLIVSQFTLYGSTAKGRRPSWSDAAPRHLAEPLIDAVVRHLIRLGGQVEVGIFGAEMSVISVNDGPFTVLVDI